MATANEKYYSDRTGLRRSAGMSALAAHALVAAPSVASGELTLDTGGAGARTIREH